MQAEIWSNHRLLLSLWLIEKQKLVIMNKKKCPYCGSPITKRNGTRNGVQLYKCQACGRQFRAGEKLSDERLWQLYQEQKQTASEIATTVEVSRSTISRRLKKIDVEWRQPSLRGMSGFVHLDVTYWGHNWGVLLALDNASNKPLYMSFVQAEKNSDYELAIQIIRENGYEIRGIIIDGKRGLFTMFAEYKIQMCHYHMKQIVFRYLTKNPRLKAAIALEVLINRLTKITKDEFIHAYDEWKYTYSDAINKRSTSKRSGKEHYTHRRLRTAMHSIDFYLPYLFTYQEDCCKGMPNTNNKIEGTFTDLKKNLNTHSGMSKQSRKRFINGFFLALESNSANQNSSESKPTADTL